jgi:hypothetical protein
MKAVTLWQPWASLVAAGVKPFEFRGWAAPPSLVGQRIGIHAGARKVRKDELADLLYRLVHDPVSTGLRQADVPVPAGALLDRWHTTPGLLPLSAVVCTVVLGKPRRVGDIFKGVHDSDRLDHSKWGWPMLDVQPLEPIVPAKGAQGFWEWSGPQ